MQQWFNNLKRQEQILLLLLATVLVIYLLIALLWRPMNEAANGFEQQNERLTENLKSVNALAEEYQSLTQSAHNSRASKQNLTRLIDTTVKKNQLSMSRFQPSSSGDVQVRFENAVYDNVLTWLHELESDHAVLIKDLSITMGSQAGIVNVSVRLRRDA